jgi:pyruvate dehydrogenase E2 component (dihydrolipoamide acetyltransferase)
MFALSTDGGLITPVVNDAANMRLSQIATTTQDLIARGRINKLTPAEYSNGTITISNLGMMGVSSFSAIINPPQSCILAIGSTVPKATPAEDGGVKWVNSMTVTTSFDHRVVDGAVGALWLQAFKRYIENPMSMLI